jgi:hypothetical protein
VIVYHILSSWAYTFSIFIDGCGRIPACIAGKENLLAPLITKPASIHPTILTGAITIKCHTCVFAVAYSVIMNSSVLRIYTFRAVAIIITSCAPQNTCAASQFRRNLVFSFNYIFLNTYANPLEIYFRGADKNIESLMTIQLLFLLSLSIYVAFEYQLIIL